MTDRDEAWEKFLNPNFLRSNLIRISLYITAFESLKLEIADKPKSFFTNGFDENGPIVSEEYGSSVLTLDRSHTKASLFWLKGLGAISDEDIRIFQTLLDYRNDLAHEPFKTLLRDDVAFDTSKFTLLIALFRKIEHWWVVNVELACDPDYVTLEVARDDVESWAVIRLELMYQIAMGQEPESGYYDRLYKHYRNMNN